MERTEGLLISGPGAALFGQRSECLAFAGSHGVGGSFFTGGNGEEEVREQMSEGRDQKPEIKIANCWIADC